VIREWTITHSLNVSAYLIRIALGIGVLLALNWKLSLLILAAMPLYAWSFVRLLPIIRKTSIALRRLNSGMYGLAQERIGGVAVVKAFAQERREELTFAARMNHWVRLSMRLINFQEILGLVAGLITAVVTGLIIYIGMTHVRDGTMSLGDVMVFIYALPNLFLQVKALSTVLTAIQAFFVVVRRVFVLLDAKEQVVPGERTLGGTDGTIELDGVWFSYPGQDGHALRDVSFRVEPGERVAIMGPSGSGKTTVFNLICRFYDPQRGAVRVGGIDLVEADPHSVREHVCMVQQEPVIFTGTVGENIAYGHPDARPSDIMRAAKQAELHEFIMTLPVKYETEVGRNGISLSGGQKQRLALATALLTDPEVLLLDDTTSALDAETEARIRATLNNVLAGRTSLIITQRIATARDCHKILVFEDGRVTQVGNHGSLVDRPGFYRRIYQQQESLSLERS
jgi:ATP-binding cassette, subfamily B, bacterial